MIDPVSPVLKGSAEFAAKPPERLGPLSVVEHHGDVFRHIGRADAGASILAMMRFEFTRLLGIGSTRLRAARFLLNGH